MILKLAGKRVEAKLLVKRARVHGTKTGAFKTRLLGLVRKFQLVLLDCHSVSYRMSSIQFSDVLNYNTLSMSFLTFTWSTNCYSCTGIHSTTWLPSLVGGPFPFVRRSKMTFKSAHFCEDGTAAFIHVVDKQFFIIWSSLGKIM